MRPSSQISSHQPAVETPHCSAGEREPAVPGENLVLHQTLVHCPAPDQVCHHEEIGSNGRGSQDQARRARVQAALPDSLLEACTQVALNVDLGVPGAQSVRYFRTAVPLPALGLSPMSRSGSWLVRDRKSNV